MGKEGRIERKSYALTLHPSLEKQAGGGMNSASFRRNIGNHSEQIENILEASTRLVKMLKTPSLLAIGSHIWQFPAVGQ